MRKLCISRWFYLHIHPSAADILPAGTSVLRKKRKRKMIARNEGLERMYLHKQRTTRLDRFRRSCWCWEARTGYVNTCTFVYLKIPSGSKSVSYRRCTCFLSLRSDGKVLRDMIFGNGTFTMAGVWYRTLLGAGVRAIIEHFNIIQ